MTTRKWNKAQKQAHSDTMKANWAKRKTKETSTDINWSEAGTRMLAKEAERKVIDAAVNTVARKADRTSLKKTIAKTTPLLQELAMQDICNSLTNLVSSISRLAGTVGLEMRIK